MLHLKRVRFLMFFVMGVMISFALVYGDGGRPTVAAYNAPAGDESGVLKNLLTAYDIESNAHNLYLLFSEKAKKEGYLQVALLFRAMVDSVNVQKENHAEAIKAMGGTPQSDLKQPTVKTTAENLQEAIKGESVKFNDIYTPFLENARQKRDRPALRTFNFSKTIAEEHVNFLKEAYANLEKWKTVNIRLWVCSVCGNMATELNFSQCPVCFNPLSKYYEIKMI